MHVDAMLPKGCANSPMRRLMSLPGLAVYIALAFSVCALDGSCLSWAGPLRATSGAGRHRSVGLNRLAAPAIDLSGDSRRAHLLWVGAGSCAVAFAFAAVRVGGLHKRQISAGLRAQKGEGGVQQLLGMKGATDEEVPLWKIRLQLTKPVTWPPLLLGVVCGTCASGNFTWSTEDFGLLAVAAFLAGPCLAGFTQTINDWYDREIDAINEPYRPIPSGKITESEVWQQIYVLLFTGLASSLAVDFKLGHLQAGFPSVFFVALFGSFLAYIYSAPPLKLKVNGWTGGYALAFSYVALPWWCGQAIFGALNVEILLLTAFYSIAAIGISIVNDFKSMDGDSKLGLDSIPVMYGADTAKYLTCGLIDAIQLCIAAWLVYIGQMSYALGLLGLMVPQLIAQKVLLLEDPFANDVKFQASSLPFFQFGIAVTACAIGASPNH